MTKSIWSIDQAHSSIEFSVKHMVFATAKGRFNEFTAKLEADLADLTTADVLFSISTESIDTGNDERDAHLRSADFFDVENFPDATFQGVNIVSLGNGEYDVAGLFTLRGITKEEVFRVTFEGQGVNPWGAHVSGFRAESKLKRSDYGLVWNAALETGGVLVGDEIKISIQLEATKQNESL